MAIRKHLGQFNLDKIDELGLPPPFDNFVAFREVFLTASQHLFETHALALSKLSKVLKEVTTEPPKRNKFAHCPAQAIFRGEFTFPTLEEQIEQEVVLAPVVVENGAGAPPPPPPPPPPIPPRPGFWRFPGAEISAKGVKR